MRMVWIWIKRGGMFCVYFWLNVGSGVLGLFQKGVGPDCMDAYI